MNKFYILFVTNSTKKKIEELNGAKPRDASQIDANETTYKRVTWHITKVKFVAERDTNTL